MAPWSKLPPMYDCLPGRSLSRASALALFGACVVACGARGPLDSNASSSGSLLDSGAGSATRDSGSGGGSGSSSGGSSGGGDDDGPPIGDDASVPPDASPPVPDAGSSGDGSLLDCGTCVATTCGSQVAACLTDTTCSTVLQCIATTCLAGGTGNLGCFTTCANGDLSSLSSLLGIITCITSSCGSDCGSVLGGLGGLSGLSGLRAGGAFAPNAGPVLFSAYPELCGR